MCGIAGVFHYHDQPLDSNNYETMLKTMKRRGPDQQGIYSEESIALLHARLSIVDLEHGKQPMHFQDYVLIYNGELYNTNELRDELIALGYTFESHSDTEVLLKCYAHWKEKCVEKLNGIFAFAVWSKTSKTLFIARDRIGVKPFFFVNKDQCFYFASEIKTLLAHPDIPAQIDAHGIAEIMLIGPGRTPGFGVFKHIQELKPGHYGIINQHSFEIKPYFTLQDRVHTDNFDETVAKVSYLVQDAIERQLVSDVPVATFLSGGLDSSIISSVASSYLKKQGKRLKTFSVGYKENEKYFKASKFQPNSDAYYIQQMTQYLQSDHHEIILDSKDLVDSLFEAVDARDLPGMADVDSSLLLFCKKIKEHVTVALSGECADELFGGYPWFRDKEIRMQEGFPWAQSTKYRSQFLKDKWREKIDAEAYVNELYEQTLAQVPKVEGIDEEEGRMREMFVLNIKWFMQTLLDRKDRMSMYNSLEVRVPFCDMRILDYLYSVPWSMKDYKGREKGLLREAMKDWLPEEVLHRKKSPYPKTFHPEYRAAVEKLLQDIIDDESSPLLQIVKKEKLEELLKEDRAIPWYGQLMTTPQTIAYFVQINYWMKKFKIEIVE